MEHGLTLAATRGGSNVVIPPGKPAPRPPGSIPSRRRWPRSTPTRHSTKDSDYELAAPAATASTMAYAEPDAAQAGLEVAGNEPSSRFTKVEEEKESRAAWYSDLVANLGSWQTLGLLSGLVIVVAAAWYGMQPASADRMYEEIQTLLADGKTDEAASKIDAFAKHYPLDRARRIWSTIAIIWIWRGQSSAPTPTRTAWCV